ncbi:MAG TPA: PEP-CTERM sorting domain-containing protein [Edaphobacter sp.]|nr:PEP-CTERM sorting domain-containing protein [Edaphobacter sp.]
MKRFGISLFGLSVLLLSAQALRADSIVLTSQIGGVYGYGVLLNPNSPGVAVANGDTLMFLGLSGVTGASAAPDTGFIVTFTSTSVTFTETGGGASTPANPTGSPAQVSDLFFIDSSNTTVGDVSYSATTTSGPLAGTAEGPVAPPPAVPEPSSMILAGSGLLGLAGAVRRRFIA